MVYSCPEGKQYCRKFGNRREVLDGISYCTTGKLTADRRRTLHPSADATWRRVLKRNPLPRAPGTPDAAPHAADYKRVLGR